jgi:hypothetical protein
MSAPITFSQSLDAKIISIGNIPNHVGCKVLARHKFSIVELQKDLDEWLIYYNNDRTHQGKMCNGRTPMDTLLDGKRIWAQKNLNQI